MTYVLGSAGNAGAPPRLQLTCQGDDFYSLGAAYGMSGPDILKMQPGLKGKNAVGIQNWIKALPGWTREKGLRKYVPGNAPGTTGPDGKPEGWAIFTDKTMILLPDMPRLDGKKPGNVSSDVAIKPPKVRDDIKTASVGPIAVVLGGAALAWLIVMGKKKKAKKPSPAPVL